MTSIPASARPLHSAWPMPEVPPMTTTHLLYKQRNSVLFYTVTHKSLTLTARRLDPIVLTLLNGLNTIRRNQAFQLAAAG